MTDNSKELEIFRGRIETAPEELMQRTLAAMEQREKDNAEKAAAKLERKAIHKNFAFRAAVIAAVITLMILLIPTSRGYVVSAAENLINSIRNWYLSMDTENKFVFDVCQAETDGDFLYITAKMELPDPYQLATGEDLRNEGNSVVSYVYGEISDNQGNKYKFTGDEDCYDFQPNFFGEFDNNNYNPYIKDGSGNIIYRIFIPDLNKSFSTNSKYTCQFNFVLYYINEEMSSVIGSEIDRQTWFNIDEYIDDKFNFCGEKPVIKKSFSIPISIINSKIIRPDITLTLSDYETKKLIPFRNNSTTDETCENDEIDEFTYMYHPIQKNSLARSSKIIDNIQIKLISIVTTKTTNHAILQISGLETISPNDIRNIRGEFEFVVNGKSVIFEIDGSVFYYYHYLLTHSSDQGYINHCNSGYYVFLRSWNTGDIDDLENINNIINEISTDNLKINFNYFCLSIFENGEWYPEIALGDMNKYY